MGIFPIFYEGLTHILGLQKSTLYRLKQLRAGGRIIMKEPYETPVIEIIEIDAEDIIMSSAE